MMKIIFNFLALSIAGILLVGCKPTEKGYQSAYDAAINKREKKQSEYNQDVAVTVLQDSDGPMLKKINGKDIYVLSENLKPLDDSIKINAYNLAVGSFKMPTNCDALIKDLKEMGIDAFAAKTGEDKYYVLTGSYNTLEAAADAYEVIRNSGIVTYIGLPGAPLIILSKTN